MVLILLYGRTDKLTKVIQNIMIEHLLLVPILDNKVARWIVASGPL